MIINHKYKFIFIKTRKTACTSVEIALSKFCDSNDVITPIFNEDEIKRKKLGYIGPQNYKIPFRFYKKIDWLKLFFQLRYKTFVNHSNALFIKENIDKEVWDTYFKFSFDRNPYDKAISRFYWGTNEPRPKIVDYLMDVSIHLISNWNIYTINDHVIVDFVGKFENLEGDLEKIVERLGIPEKLDLPRTKGKYRTNREHYTKIIDKQSQSRIEMVCAKEIKYLNYKWQ